jgi:hypothetical protein
MVVICDATWRFFSELESTDIGSSLEETGSGFLEQNIKLKRAENIYVFWPLRIDFRETTGFLFSFCCFFISSSLRRLSSSSRLSFALNECTLIITVVCSNKSGSRLCLSRLTVAFLPLFLSFSFLALLFAPPVSFSFSPFLASFYFRISLWRQLLAPLAS